MTIANIESSYIHSKKASFLNKSGAPSSQESQKNYTNTGVSYQIELEISDIDYLIKHIDDEERFRSIIRLYL